MREISVCVFSIDMEPGCRTGNSYICPLKTTPLTGYSVGRVRRNCSNIPHRLVYVKCNVLFCVGTNYCSVIFGTVSSNLSMALLKNALFYSGYGICDFKYVLNLNVYLPDSGCFNSVEERGMHTYITKSVP